MTLKNFNYKIVKIFELETNITIKFIYTNFMYLHNIYRVFESNRNLKAPLWKHLDPSVARLLEKFQ